MRIHLVAVGTRMPGWVQEGFSEYAGRLPHECRLVLQQIPMARRNRGSSTAQLQREEAERMTAAIPAGTLRVALEVKGSEWSTEQLSGQLSRWMLDGRDVALLVGGPDGLEPSLSASCEQRWSLSRLTLPHPLVRVMVAEQVYRAWSLLRGHPYHRG